MHVKDHWILHTHTHTHSWWTDGDTILNPSYISSQDPPPPPPILFFFLWILLHWMMAEHPVHIHWIAGIELLCVRACVCVCVCACVCVCMCVCAHVGSSWPGHSPREIRAWWHSSSSPWAQPEVSNTCDHTDLYTRWYVKSKQVALRCCTSNMKFLFPGCICHMIYRFWVRKAVECYEALNLSWTMSLDHGRWPRRHVTSSRRTAAARFECEWEEDCCWLLTERRVSAEMPLLSLWPGFRAVGQLTVWAWFWNSSLPSRSTSPAVRHNKTSVRQGLSWILRSRLISACKQCKLLKWLTPFYFMT